jgi:hypothetical protein
MSIPDDSQRSSPMDGSRTAADGTPFPVDVFRDRRARVTSLVFVAGPVIWSVHFMVVYLVTEAGCTGDGPGLRLFDPPVPKVVTLAATAAAAVASVACAWWAYRRWRPRNHEPATDEGGDRGGSLAFAGFLLSLLSFVMVLFVGVPALVLPSC